MLEMLEWTYVDRGERPDAKEIYEQLKPHAY